MLVLGIADTFAHLSKKEKLHAMADEILTSMFVKEKCGGFSAWAMRHMGGHFRPHAAEVVVCNFTASSHGVKDQYGIYKCAFLCSDTQYHPHDGVNTETKQQVWQHNTRKATG